MSCCRDGLYIHNWTRQIEPHLGYDFCLRSHFGPGAGYLCTLCLALAARNESSQFEGSSSYIASVIQLGVVTW
ncbi:hypothetical protein M431DRAFT_196325 [Trichoderma harzianum CBS 226.95]|uniref:Uncharacterized protein n=1 Tax=Trichoderma harzianum CBS 226.95 TaxID=983964 RepID=A0A2T4AUN4_TRIHA|nr:hypothetical protein M431DRAFT_196325 [Trichoderma harzianum CBS 226.95]PTB60774.1 hypothetical protein M431DRAFT_196325 [Trichoderma harzianum CBS 226.95]